jgi:hypothetical protein
MRNFMIVTFTVVLAAVMPGDAHAQISGLGLGLVVGEPTGVTARGKYGANNYQAHAAWSFRGQDALHVSLDYLRSSVTNGGFPFYFGLGARVKFQTDFGLAARVPVGVNHFLDTQPIELFAEAVPMFEVLPATDISFNAAVGARYYFGN